MKSDMEKNFTKKSEFRTHCKQKLLFASIHKRVKNSKSVLRRIDAVLKNVKNSKILCYLPLQNEVDLRAIFPKIRRKNTLLVPFMEGISFKVVKYRLPLFEKTFHIKEPRNSFMKFFDIDIAIVPVIGVDGDFRRIGFGKGMYDRFFTSLKRRPLVIFVQIEHCCTKFGLGESHDIQADIYITPQKTILKRGIYDNRSRTSSRSRYSRSRSRIFCR